MGGLDPAVRRLLERPEAERRLGSFRLLRELDRGGFAPVWLAREELGGAELRTVAVKLFAVDHDAVGDTGGRVRRDRIVDEVRALCRVEHPNIVRFFTLVTDPEQDVLGLVMEHLHGRSLDKRLLEDGKLAVPEAVAVGLAVASALSAVHQVGLVHRDIKPHNVIDNAGICKLIDFGVAHHRARPAGEKARRRMHKQVIVDDLPLEVAGTQVTELSAFARQEGGSAGLGVSGTVGYIDPAALGGQIGAPSDLYSLGATLFECLTGVLPAAAAARAAGSSGLKGEVLDGRSRPPPLADLEPGVPEPLARLVDSLLDPDPAGRPRTAELVVWELERIRGTLSGRERALPDEELGPFRGLGRFEQGDRDVYFGRSVEVAAGVEILRGHGLLALVGPSGSGKSSLARAGVVPAVLDGRLGGWPKHWDAVVTAPGTDPSHSLTVAFSRLVLSVWDADSQAADLLDQALRGCRGPEATVSALAEHAQQSGRGVLLVIDQLEELVTIADRAGREQLVALCERIGSAPPPGVRCIVGARRDLLDPLLGVERLGRVLTRGMLLVQPLTPEVWGDVIDHALDAYGYRLESEAMRRRIVAGLETTVEAMPLVQFALTELWQRRDADERVIPERALDDIGGIAGALDMHAETTRRRLLEVNPSLESALYTVVMALTTPQGTRASLSAADLRKLADERAVDVTVAAFEEARLFVREGEVITLAHEALLTQWWRLERWLAVAREDRVLAEEVEREAESWEADRAEERLWRKRRLLAAEDLRRAARLSERATGFLRASRRAEQRGRMLAGTLVGLVLAAGALATYGYVRQIDDSRRALERALREARANEHAAQQARRSLALSEQTTEELRAQLKKAATDKERRRLTAELARRQASPQPGDTPPRGRLPATPNPSAEPTAAASVEPAVDGRCGCAPDDKPCLMRCKVHGTATPSQSTHSAHGALPGVVLVVVQGGGCVVTVAGQSQVVGTRALFKVPFGTHTVVCTPPDTKPRKKAVTLTADNPVGHVAFDVFQQKWQ